MLGELVVALKYEIETLGPEAICDLVVFFPREVAEGEQQNWLSTHLELENLRCSRAKLQRRAVGERLGSFLKFVVDLFPLLEEHFALSRRVEGC